MTATQQTSYPLSQRFSIQYSAYEDRLILRATLRDGAPIMVLLTRRMVLILLQQVLSRLPALAGLEKTPREFWAEVLQLGHQQALQEGSAAQASQAEAASRTAAKSATAADPEALRPSTATDDEASDDKQSADAGAGRSAIWLATDLVIGHMESGLTLAYKGLRMPDAMIQPGRREPVVAFPLKVAHLHQLIHLVVGQSRRADWHLPLDLPWMEAPDDEVPGTVITH